MADNREPEEVSQELMKQIDDLIRQAEGLIEESDRNFYQKHGIQRGDIQRFMESDKIPEEHRARIEQEQQAWQEELERDVKLAQDEAKGGSAKPRRGRPGMMRI